MPLSRISWLVTVGVCLVAALLLLVSGYVGYFGILLVLAASASVNLLDWPKARSREREPGEAPPGSE
ncbi:MAG: hypothetical protein IRZ21_07270 [Thermoleophilaceae bacterium]|nr:hypothetical protein [Thermoleophilaceae bacterium]